MLACDLIPQLQKRIAAANLHAFDQNDLDITSWSTLQERLGQIRPAVVLNCAAYNDVDGCESNMDRAREVTGVAPR